MGRQFELQTEVKACFTVSGVNELINIVELQNVLSSSCMMTAADAVLIYTVLFVEMLTLNCSLSGSTAPSSSIGICTHFTHSV